MSALDREAFPDVEVKGSTVHVRYHIDPWMLTKANGRRAFDRNAAEIVPGLFARFSNVGAVDVGDIRRLADDAWYDPRFR